MDCAIKFTLEESQETTSNGIKTEKLNFLDMIIMIDENGNISTDIYYKPTNSHDYLHYDSFHPSHTLDNIPYCLAKKIIVFVSDPELMEKRLLDLKIMLKKCLYPDDVINKGFHNAKLQGPAPKTDEKSNIIPYIHCNMSNFKFNNIVNTAKNLLQTSKSDSIRKIFQNTRFVVGTSQPKNILRIITNKQTTIQNNERPGIFAECSDKRCKLCSLNYIVNCTTFTTSNNTKWEIRSHINCNSKNVIYYLECLMCNGKVTKCGKTENKLRTRMNNHISDCLTGNTTDIFDQHVHKCGIEKNCLTPPYFRIKAFMKLSSPDKLLTYENTMHQRKYATINT